MTPTTPEVSLLFATDRTGAIATNDSNSVLSTKWTSPEDLQRFISMTRMAQVLVCGRTTYDTFPKKPLRGRLNVVYTNDPALLEIVPTDELEYTNLPPAELIQSLVVRGFKNIPICGGAEIYKLFWDAGVVNTLHVTEEPLVLSGTERIMMPFDIPSCVKAGALTLGDEWAANEKGTMFRIYQVPKH